MHQDWQEKGIKSLFDELRREDRLSAPPFERVGGVRLAFRARRTRALRLALGGAVILLVVGAGFYVATRGSKRAGQNEVAVNPPPQETETRKNPLPPKLIPTPAPAPMPIVNRVRRGRQYEAALISQWRSPTDFLLVTPGDQLLRTVPRLGASPALKTGIPDSNN